MKMTNGKIIPVLSETGLKSVEKLEKLGILVKEEQLSDDVRKVNIDKLLELSAGGYRGGFEAAWIASLHTFIRTKNLLTDPYITIEMAGKKEKKPDMPGAGMVHRKKDDIVTKCSKCGLDSKMGQLGAHIWVRGGLYSYEVVRTISSCRNCGWSNRIEIQNEEQARIDSGDMTGWGARV
jgi:RNase P subunit RPR2